MKEKVLTGEQQKHLNKIKFYANKWEEADKRSTEIKMKITALEIELREVQKISTSYSRKTKGAILLEVI